MIDPHSLATLETPLRIGVLGAGGQLGRCLVRELEATTDLALAFASTREECDLTETDQVAGWLDALPLRRPDVVVNAAAYTKVDSCESEPALAYQTNALAPAEWARELALRGVRFVHLSTDYVFPGDRDRPYREDDPTDPKTVYGASKRAGEIAVLGSDPTALVVRTSWVFGPGRNFVVAILDQAARRRSGEIVGPLKVVDDQHGAPTSAADLARALLELCRRREVRGLLHLRNAGETTWYGFARAILDQAGDPDLVIDPVPTSAFKTTAPRPAYSVLSCERAAGMGIVMRPWGEALHDYLMGPDAPRSLMSNARRSVGQEASA